MREEGLLVRAQNSLTAWLRAPGCLLREIHLKTEGVNHSGTTGSLCWDSQSQTGLLLWVGLWVRTNWLPVFTQDSLSTWRLEISFERDPDSVITGDPLRHLILITHRLLRGEVWIFWASIHPFINRTATFQKSFSSVGASGSKSQRWFSAWMVFRWHTNGHGTIHVESFVITAAAAFRNDPVWNGPDAFCAEFSTVSPQKKQHQAAAHRKLTSITQTCSIIKEKKSSTSWKIRFFAFSLSVRLENQFPSQSAIDQWEQWTFSLCATKVSILFCSWPLNQPESQTVSSYMMKKQEATSVKLQIINRVIV